DNLHFDLSFPRGIKPYAIMLRKDLPSPFIPVPKAPHAKEKEGNGSKKQENGGEEDMPKKQEHEAEATAKEENGEQEEDSETKKPSLIIDLEGITSRVLPFPVPEGRFRSVLGIRGKALFLSFPIEGSTH